MIAQSIPRKSRIVIAGAVIGGELQQLFGHWHAPISALIESTPAETIPLSDIYDHPAQHPWTDGVVTLLGDAAHPMTPGARRC